MKIAGFINSKLSFYKIASGNKKDEKLYTALHWIASGIRTGQITGEEKELKDFILSYLKDNEDLAATNQRGLTPVSLLFIKDGLPEPTQEIKQNILLTFRLFFERNKLAIIKSDYLRRYDYDTVEKPVVAESAVERIGNFPELLQALEPELLAFIMEYAPSLHEATCRLLVHAFHDNQKLVRQLDKTLSDNFNRSELERNRIEAGELREVILNHWCPGHKKDAAYFYNKFPAMELWRLFMDGNKQIEEDGWSQYEGRENGCINSLYNAWLYTMQTMDMELTPQYFKTIHAICSENIASISGEYRKYEPVFGMSPDSMSFLGYLEFIDNYKRLCTLRKAPKQCFHACSVITTEALDSTIEVIITNYKSKISAGRNNPIDLLKSIIILCKQLELVHPFSDCNGRVFCNLILNRQLILNGFSPVLLDNPNRLEGWSINESLYEVIRGMNNFKQLKNERKYKDSKTTLELMTLYPYPISKLCDLSEISGGPGEIPETDNSFDSCERNINGILMRH
ncbi:Fic family protein [Legionella spiritensis]|uniref:Fic family protein n=1 Tax=Legionella spiritensis TaxID=452 RepID=UPI000F706DF2|nr:Fic family protein [Legionella spiritensis]VEG92290.1 ankyrin repeat-containing protein [Legionella spiritensis]